MLGTALERALSRIGVTSEEVERWLGKKCGCKERRDKLDALGLWARKWASGQLDEAKRWFGILTQREQDNEPATDLREHI